MISDFYTRTLQGSPFRKFRDFILNLDNDERLVGPQECVGRSSATTESRVEPDDSSVCPAPGPSLVPRLYAKINHTIDNTDLSSKILCEQQGMTVSKTGGLPTPSPSVTPYSY